MKTYSPKKEWMAYCIGAFGQGMVYAMMSSYISDFYMNVMKLTPLFVLFLMLFARIWDSFNDPIMGYIMDRVNLKNGKMRPYLLYAPIPVAILTVLLFQTPNISMTGLMVYAAVTYVLWDMAYTVCDVPFWGLPNALTPNPDERGVIISRGRTANGVGSAVPIAFFMVLGPVLARMHLSGTQLEQTKYTVIALFCSVLGNILFARVYFKTRERVSIPNPPKRKKGEQTAFGRLFRCKPLMLTALSGVLSAARYMYQAGAVHVARYSIYVGKDLTGLSLAEKEAALQSNISLVSTIFQVASAAGMFGTMLVMPLLFKRWNYKQILMGTCILGAVSGAVIWFLGYDNFLWCIPFFVIACIPLGAINVCTYAMLGDCLDYMEWKTGVRQTGLGAAVQGFIAKFGNAISTSFIIVMYMIVNLDVASINASVTANPLEMSETVRTGMFSLISIIPAISMVLCIIPLFFYDLVGEKKARITKELAEQRAARGIVIEEG